MEYLSIESQPVPLTFESDQILRDEALCNAPRKAELTSEVVEIGGQTISRVIGEFWTAKQRQASSIHEVSYRACFKPQLPSYFIKRFTSTDGVVYDPFSGRGTTAIEAALLGRRIIANDINPLSAILARPRVDIPTVAAVADRLEAIPYYANMRAELDLSMFYDPRTESEIASLRNYLRDRHEAGTEDKVDSWIRMVATGRLTGHSPGFFSVYTLPPNQATSAKRQVKINQQRSQTPEYRNTKSLILKKTRQLLGSLTPGDLENLKAAKKTAVFLTGSASKKGAIPDDHVDLTVTSPPFLDVVQYAGDNWLRCWFNTLPLEEIASAITMEKTLEGWCDKMAHIFDELFRITRPGGVVAFEVGEVRKGHIKLEEHVVPLATSSGFYCEAILINSQAFTKTANLWGVSNNESGTNSNRIVVLRKP